MGAPDYAAFLASKESRVIPAGIEPGPLNPMLFPFQREIVEWALRLGRAALFTSCGTGKTPMQLEWAQRVVESTGGSVLILCPLAVAQQTVREGEKFGIKVAYARSQAAAKHAGITATNYEMLKAFDPGAFAGVVLDESSILKSFMGATKRKLMEAFARTPYRLCCTATPAPNDHMEIGNHSEFLGVLPSCEMLTRWFINDTSNFGTYRLKHHAVDAFWDWVASWAVCVDRPSDLGNYSDAGFVLPSLTVTKHSVPVDLTIDRGDRLFRLPELSATSLHKEKRLTASTRADRLAVVLAAESKETWVVWCDTDYEADALTAVLPDAVEVRGSHPLERKEEALWRFTCGHTKQLIVKPRIAGFGLNWQHCARVGFIGPSFSYEQWYQAIRRTWRFGQTRDVRVHVIMAETERAVWDVLQRKAGEHEAMKDNMFAATRRAHARSSPRIDYSPQHVGHIPAWLQSEVRP